MGSALGCLGRRGKAGSMALDGGAALGAGNSPECGVPVPGVAYNFEDLAQKKREGLAMLTEAWSGRGATQVAPALMEGGGVRVGARERPLQGSEQRETARGRSGRRGGAGALLGRDSGVVEGRGRGGAALLRAEKSRRRR